MNTQKIIASVAAVLLTTATLGVVNYNVPARQSAAATATTPKITNLAPVVVRPSSADLRAAMIDLDAGGSADAVAVSDAAAPLLRFDLVGAQLAMPYYSFGNKFGRISKE